MSRWIGLLRRLGWSTPARVSDDRGFTLVEVMAAGAILSVVGLGLVNAWAVMDRMSFDTLLRQKAVFVLNAEMERLATLYRTTDFGHGPRETTKGYPEMPGLSGGDLRLTYKTDSRGVENSSGDRFVVKTDRFAEFIASNDKVWLIGAGDDTRNYVWLDRDRSLAARISWTECEISNTVVSYCWDGILAERTKLAGLPGFLQDQLNPYRCAKFDGNDGGERCRLIQLVLEYAFRVDVGAKTVAPTAAGGNRTLTLSTIVGRRFVKS